MRASYISPVQDEAALEVIKGNACRSGCHAVHGHGPAVRVAVAQPVTMYPVASPCQMTRPNEHGRHLKLQVMSKLGKQLPRRLLGTLRPL